MSARVGVIGAGFYGLEIASFMARMGFNVDVHEREPRAGLHASWANQSRVHAGYHYPRSFRTGYRSASNYARFKSDYSSSIYDNFEAVYAIAKKYSKTSAGQFTGFCRRARLPLFEAPSSILRLFESNLVEAAFLVEEAAFDGGKLASEAANRAEVAKVNLVFNSCVKEVVQSHAGAFILSSPDLGEEYYDLVIDATYSRLGTLFAPAHSLSLRIKRERAEIAFFHAPHELENLGITLMDGPFFSFMPFPARGLHSLTHVTYTPRDSDTSRAQSKSKDKNNSERMLRDASRFVPSIQKATYSDSIFIDKAVLVSSEVDDSRPILFHQSGLRGRYISVLGSKIDNIYDALDSLTEIDAVRELLDD